MEVSYLGSNPTLTTEKKRAQINIGKTDQEKIKSDADTGGVPAYKGNKIKTVADRTWQMLTDDTKYFYTKMFQLKRTDED